MTGKMTVLLSLLVVCLQVGRCVYVLDHAVSYMFFTMGSLVVLWSLRGVSGMEGLGAGSEGLHPSLPVGGSAADPQWGGLGDGGGAAGRTPDAHGHHPTAS